MKLKILCILALLYAPVIWGKSAVIKKVYLSRDEASAEFLADYKAYPKQYLVAKFANGKNCSLEIKKVYKRLALLDLRHCIYRHFLKVGQTLSRWKEIENDIDIVSVSVPPGDELSRKEDFWFDVVEQVESKEQEEKLKISQGLALSILYAFANELQTSGNVSGGTEMETKEYTTGAFGLGVEYFYSIENSVGWNAGWTLEIVRRFSNRDVYYEGSTTSQSLEDETLWLNVLSANVNFTIVWKLYFYGGVNLSLPLESGNKLNTNPALGGQVGLGKIVSRRAIFDFQYRWVNFKGSGDYVQGISNWDSATFNGPVLSVKYLFE